MCLKDSSNNICLQHTLKFLPGIIYSPTISFGGGGGGGGGGMPPVFRKSDERFMF